MTYVTGGYIWDYYVMVEFLQPDCNVREKEYHLSLNEDITATQAMIMAIERAGKDLQYGEMICGVTVI